MVWSTFWRSRQISTNLPKLSCVFNNNNWFLIAFFKALYSVLLLPITGFNINPALIVHLLNSLGSILARRHFRGAHVPHQATNNVRILPGTHLYTWVESSNVDKVSCWRTKVPGIDGNWTSNPLIQSQGYNSMFYGTSDLFCISIVYLTAHSPKSASIVLAFAPKSASVINLLWFFSDFIFLCAHPHCLSLQSLPSPKTSPFYIIIFLL